MNYKTVKQPQKRYTVSYNSAWGIQMYGDDNLYPNRQEDLIKNSPTGGTCLERYISFLEGNGFYNEDFARYVCNRYGDTMDDILRQVASDIGKFNGFALHVNYNVDLDISELQYVPFKTCRLDEEDDNGYIPFISIHPDWEGNKTRRGKPVAVNKKTIRKVYPFNPIKTVVMAQIEADGGIESYRGQILWVSVQGGRVYPTTMYDKVTTELSVDEGISNVKYRNVRNNFLPAALLMRRKGLTVVTNDDGTESFEEESDDALQEELATFQGDENACAIMDITYQQEEDIPKYQAIEGVNFDKKFLSTESSTVERIYAAFGQEPWYCVRVGKVGFSGDVLREAYEYYNSYVDNTRRIMTRAIESIFLHWGDKECPLGDYRIEPLIYQYNYANGNLDETQRQNGADGHNNTGNGDDNNR